MNIRKRLVLPKLKRNKPKKNRPGIKTRTIFKIKKWHGGLSERQKNFIDFIVFVFEYGIFINLILYGIFNISITIQSIVAWGLLYYFISYEFRAIYDGWKEGR